MNYRHAYHAGNFADVFKHIILTRLLEYMKTKDKPFRVFDTHSGIGSYDLGSEQAAKTEEWQQGVKRVMEAEAPAAVNRLIGPWKDAVRAVGEGKYPGSPRVAHGLLRKSDRLSLFELHEEDSQQLKQAFADDYQTRVYESDGWLAPVGHIPPKEKRGVMLVDPPFEDGKDFDRMIDVLKKCDQRWPGGVVALWYPVKRREHTDEWLETLSGLKFKDLINVELYIREPRPVAMLNGCGMVILNPPYVLGEALHQIMPWLSETLKQDKGWGYRIQNLSAK